MACRPFISYAKEDAAIAEQLYGDLLQLGAEPWLDSHELRGGETWKQAIRDALRRSTHVLTLISASSVSKTGFVQNEVRQALELLDSMPPDRVFVVPVRLDPSTPQHERLKDLHWIDLFPDYPLGLQKIAASLELDTSVHPRRQDWRGAIGVTVIFAILLAGVTVGARYVGRQSAEPDVISDSRVLYPDGRRGSEGAIGVDIPTHASVLLTFAALPEASFPDYRVDLMDLSVTPPKTIWTRRGVRVTGDGLFAITIPNAYLHEGVYELRLVGIDGTSSARIANYTIRAGRT